MTAPKSNGQRQNTSTLIRYHSTHKNRLVSVPSIEGKTPLALSHTPNQQNKSEDQVKHDRKLHTIRSFSQDTNAAWQSCFEGTNHTKQGRFAPFSFPTNTQENTQHDQPGWRLAAQKYRTIKRASILLPARIPKNKPPNNSKPVSYVEDRPPKTDSQ